MPTELGSLIRRLRTERNIGVREFARLIGKSPAFVTNLEVDDTPPSASEETLREIAKHLHQDPYAIITLAGKTPKEVAPASALDAALYRRVKALSDVEKRKLLTELGSTPPPPD